ncbi:hypothetical protein QYE76_068324 [Lolium multiflorum]|uniref:DUF4283 domain-containing protein n=1 Tax=Lolium multiflorum TaxID=4521 RepID=A0AAD8SEL1_LOLMU|nr:hypothetical protein QYE76_068324 [Lolium multiflorum]
MCLQPPHPAAPLHRSSLPALAAAGAGGDPRRPSPPGAPSPPRPLRVLVETLVPLVSSPPGVEVAQGLGEDGESGGIAAESQALGGGIQRCGAGTALRINAGGEAKAVGKVMSERPTNVEGLKTTLGRIWCPIKGVKCKDLGSNIFLFTFLQPSGKRKALENGPWKSNNDLVVMAEFDPNKARDHYVFDVIPIWIRVLKLPLGRMNS